MLLMGPSRHIATPRKFGRLYEAPRVKRLFVINIFSSSLLVSRGSRERGSALMAWQSPCLAALSGQPPEPGGSRRKARGVDGESACQATMMSPGHYAAANVKAFCVAVDPLSPLKCGLRLVN